MAVKYLSLGLFIFTVSCAVHPKDHSSTIQNMPRFPGCEYLEISNIEKDKCAKEKLDEYISEMIEYPEAAKNNGTEGTCVIQYTVNKEGVLEDILLARDIGHGCGEEALRIVKSMNDMELTWTPAKQNGKLTSVKYTLPIEFKL